MEQTLLGDTDGDVVNDYDEIFTYGTDPNDIDSDGDGLGDFDEILPTKQTRMIVIQMMMISTITMKSLIKQTRTILIQMVIL